MKTEKHYATKRLPGITARKPQLRNNSWAKLLSQQKSDKDGENGDRVIAGLDVRCEPILLNLKETRKTGQGLGKFANSVERCQEEKVEKFDEMQNTDNKMSRKRLDDNEEKRAAERCSGYGACSIEKGNKISRADFDESKTDGDHLPPLRDGNFLPKIINEKCNFPKNPKTQGESFSRKTSRAFDWQKIFDDTGGFRPSESRDLPTRGEMNLLKYKTWNADDHTTKYCATKCAKYFGLNGDNANAEKLIRKEPQNFIAVPLPTINSTRFKLQNVKKALYP